MTDDAGLAHLDCYLDQVRRHLKALPAAEAGEAVAELRAHVLDRVEGAPTAQRVEAAIAALGTPREVARINLTERIAAEVARDRSPLTVLRGVTRLALLSVHGFFVFLASFGGYAITLALLATAVAKPFLPDHAGLWWTPDPQFGHSLALGVEFPAPHGQELLGWWVIPIGLTGGLLVGYLTWRLGIVSVRQMRRAASRGRV